MKLESKKPVVLVLGTGWGAHSLIKVCWGAGSDVAVTGCWCQAGKTCWADRVRNGCTKEPFFW